MADILIVSDLRRVGDHHEYVLSRWPTREELAEIDAALERHEAPLREVVGAGYDSSASGDTIEAHGLSHGARPRIEAAILDALTAAAGDPSAKDAIHASLDDLPTDIP